jgi:hypothetical protein
MLAMVEGVTPSSFRPDPHVTDTPRRHQIACERRSSPEPTRTPCSPPPPAYVTPCFGGIRHLSISAKRSAIAAYVTPCQEELGVQRTQGLSTPPRVRDPLPSRCFMQSGPGR